MNVLGGAVMWKYFLIGCLLIVLALAGGCKQQENGTATYIDVTPAEAKDLIDNNPDLIIIDVSPHYEQGHLPGAVHYYLGDGSLDTAVPSLDKDKTYLVYCHIDSVARQGAQKLVDAGFENVYRLAGNYSGWVDAGYPVEQ
jgi:adenylyltransferase/sulfurtransferase